MTGTSRRNPSGTFLRPPQRRRTVRTSDPAQIDRVLRRRARGRDRQSRYATSLDVRREPSSARLAAALLKVVATAPPKQFRTIRPVLHALLRTMSASGYRPGNGAAPSEAHPPAAAARFDLTNCRTVIEADAMSCPSPGGLRDIDGWVVIAVLQHKDHSPGATHTPKFARPGAFA
jgi:hypothetical protein